MIHYEFKDFAAFALLKTILRNENILHEEGVGPGGMTLSVQDASSQRVQEAVRQWQDAMPLVYSEVMFK